MSLAFPVDHVEKARLVTVIGKKRHAIQRAGENPSLEIAARQSRPGEGEAGGTPLKGSHASNKSPPAFSIDRYLEHTVTMADYDNKTNTHHDEEYKAMAGHVEDSVAADYVDPTLVITPEENKKLLRKIHWQ